MIVAFLRRLEKLFDEPQTTAYQDAVAGLADAEKRALTEQSMAEYAAAQVICHRAMAEYQQKRATRLQAFIEAKDSLAVEGPGLHLDSAVLKQFPNADAVAYRASVNL